MKIIKQVDSFSGRFIGYFVETVERGAGSDMYQYKEEPQWTSQLQLPLGWKVISYPYGYAIRLLPNDAEILSALALHVGLESDEDVLSLFRNDDPLSAVREYAVLMMRWEKDYEIEKAAQMLVSLLPVPTPALS